MNKFSAIFVEFLKTYFSKIFLNQHSIKPSKEESLDVFPKQQETVNKIPKPQEIDENASVIVPKIKENDTATVKDIDDDIFLKELPPKDYWEKEFPKEMIVLHFTSGYSWQSAYNTFNKNPLRVATPFVVDIREPKYIVKLFDEKYWAYHLGIDKVYSENWKNDKRSIGIEIVNIGPAWLRDGIWRDYVKKAYKEEDIIRGKNRDADGGVKFPEEQVEAVCRLVNYLCDKWDIPRLVPKDKMSFQLPDISQFKGITAHQMFRRDKYDIGVAWPWAKMIEQCNLEEVEI